MNYIQRLEQENERLRQALQSLRNELTYMRIHIDSEKFKTPEGGERRDWISTGDIANWLDNARMITLDT